MNEPMQYLRDSEPVTAMRYDGALNKERVMEWIRSNGVIVQNNPLEAETIVVGRNDGSIGGFVVSPTDWVVRGWAGNFWRESREEFTVHYKVPKADETPLTEEDWARIVEDDSPMGAVEHRHTNPNPNPLKRDQMHSLYTDGRMFVRISDTALVCMSEVLAIDYNDDMPCPIIFTKSIAIEAQWFVATEGESNAEAVERLLRHIQAEYGPE